MATAHKKGDIRPEHGDPAASKTNERTWTRRCVYPIKYRHFTANNDQGVPHIFFKLDLPAGETALPEPVFDLLTELKLLDGYPTGLKCVRDKVHGKVWRLPNNPIGRTAACIIDARIADLAVKLGKECRNI